jgi:hypothetical protein
MAKRPDPSGRGASRRRGRIRRRGAGESVAKRLFLRVSERGLQNDTAIVLDLLDQLVGRHFLDEHKQGGVTGMGAFGELLHELVIDPEVCQRAIFGQT